MKKKLILFISALSLILSGCSSHEVNVIINADGYEGILLATEHNAAPPVSIPIFPVSYTDGYNTETASDESDTEPEEITDEDESSSEQGEDPVIPDVSVEDPDPVTAAPEPVTAAPDPVTDPPESVATTEPEPEITTTPYIETTVTTTAGTTKEEPPRSDLTPIMGTCVATAEQMRAFIKAINPDVDQKIIDMIPLYLSEGAAEGVRGDIAFAQSCVETGYFKFDKAGTGSAVTIDQNNFCGLGVTSLGVKGCSFDTPQLGIRAQIQHLKAYGSTLDLNGEQVDPRFHYVMRGCAEYWEWLGMQENPQGRGWAGAANYGPIILDIFYRVLQY